MNRGNSKKKYAEEVESGRGIDQIEQADEFNKDKLDSQEDPGNFQQEETEKKHLSKLDEAEELVSGKSSIAADPEYNHGSCESGEQPGRDKLVSKNVEILK